MIEETYEEEFEDILEVGQAAPEFSAMAFLNNEFKRVELADYKGRWVVLFFYPADFTFVCPTELASLADYYEKFKEMNVEILSISTDTHFCHKAWHDSSESIKKINFPMLSDATHEISDKYNVLIPEGGITHRGTFIISPEGILKAYEVHHDHIGRSITELVRKIKAAQHAENNPGEACPMNWDSGKETLKPGVDLVGKI